MGTRFAKFMASIAGRVIRVAFGGALLALGYVLGGLLGEVIAVAALVPIGGGLFNFCLIAPLLHAPFWGSELPAKT